MVSFIDRAIELSSMGIRVDEEALDYQLRVSGTMIGEN